MLDPACGDGRFLRAHEFSVGVEQDSRACAVVHASTPGRLIHQGDFFLWAAQTQERFDCAAGNPPFIRYHRFSGQVRETAFRLCRKYGAEFSSLASSWAPFLVATATLLKEGGRMAFVVPAEIGHAPYASPLLEFFADSFEFIQVIAVREKLFPELSEDCWLLLASNYGRSAKTIRFTAMDRFEPSETPPRIGTEISISEFADWNWRLRPFLLPSSSRDVYRSVVRDPATQRLGDVAKVGIGYVSGANDFFHLRPSEAARLQIPRELLRPSVRSGRCLTRGVVTERDVNRWIAADDRMLLLNLNRATSVNPALRAYLDSEAGHEARQSYKCRNRRPWYVVPDVTVPDGFLSYMSGTGPLLAENRAGCVCTNTLHAVRLKPGFSMARLRRAWTSPITLLSCELEGHPLGGGLLKLEPREASRVVFTPRAVCVDAETDLDKAIATMRRWRHYAE